MLDVDVQGRAGDFSLSARFSIETSGITALFGRSGAGKTTVIDMIAGLRRPAAGRIAVNSTVLFDASRGIDVPPHKRRIGYVFQDGRLFPHLSVHGNLLYGVPGAAADGGLVTFDQVVDLLGLARLIARRPATLSGGEKQRVALGRALLSSPTLLLMDEPLAALDTARRDEILPFIESLHRDVKVPIIYVSHALEEILRIADTLVLMVDGRVGAVGPVEDVVNRDLSLDQARTGEPDTVIAATVAQHDREFDLTYLAFADGRFTVPRVDVPVGARLRVRVLARDVSLATSAPANLSILNTFAGTIQAVAPSHRGTVLVKLALAGGQPLTARVTRRAAHDLGLTVGATAHALVKGVAVGRYGPGQWDETAITPG